MKKIIYSWDIKDFSDQDPGAVGVIISIEDDGHHVRVVSVLLVEGNQM